MATTDSSTIPTTPSPMDYETLFYVACGVGGTIVLILLAVITYLAVRVKRRSRKSEDVEEDGEYANEAYQDDDLQNDHFMDDQPQEQKYPIPLSSPAPAPIAGDIIYGKVEETVIKETTAEPPAADDFDKDVPPLHSGIPPVIPPTKTAGGRQRDRIERQDFEDGLRSSPHHSAQHRPRPRDGPAHLKDTARMPVHAPQVYDEQDIYRPSKQPGRRPKGDIRYSDGYDLEMAQYPLPPTKPAQRESRGRPREDEDEDDDHEETASVSLPRVRAIQKPRKRASSISELSVIRETTTKVSKTRPWPKGVELGFNYTNPTRRLDQDFPLSAQRDLELDRQRPKELSQREFTRRRRAVEEQAVRAPRLSNSRDTQLDSSYDQGYSRDQREEQRRTGRQSTSASPTRYRQSRY